MERVTAGRPGPRVRRLCVAHWRTFHSCLPEPSCPLSRGETQRIPADVARPRTPGRHGNGIPVRTDRPEVTQPAIIRDVTLRLSTRPESNEWSVQTLLGVGPPTRQMYQSRRLALSRQQRGQFVLCRCRCLNGAPERFATCGIIAPFITLQASAATAGRHGRYNAWRGTTAGGCDRPSVTGADERDSLTSITRSAGLGALAGDLGRRDPAPQGAAPLGRTPVCLHHDFRP